METLQNRDTLVQVHNLSVRYRTRLGEVSAVDGLSLDIRRGEILGLVGESGCGKSTLGKALLRMIAPPGEICDGEIIFEGENILAYNQEQIRDFRGRKSAMIFQDPMTSLNPVQRVDEHIIEAIQVHETGTTKTAARERARSFITRLGIQAERLSDYPHQLSGGMRQRIMISLGLILNASLVVADEATTSLDVIVEANLLDELRNIRQAFGVTLLLITHNIAVVAQLADRVAVMYAGRLMEIGSVFEIFDHPLHPYSQGLLNSVPSIKLDERDELYRMPGEPPNLTRPPQGCRFHPRCPMVMPVCRQAQPDLISINSEHRVHCWLYQESDMDPQAGRLKGTLV
ncbi:MAG: ABC transporter ATP-binding protein [Anaerolineales bacterium]|nr:ABC transporter ATP-binding protein [Anaerolineales bacterium]